MSGLMRNALRFALLKRSSNVLKNGPSLVNLFETAQPARNLWHAVRVNNISPNYHPNQPSSAPFHTKGVRLLNKPTNPEAQLTSTQGEKELAEFLVDEISAEKKLQKTKTIPCQIDGFNVTLDGSEVLMTKKTGDEVIEVSFNINHSVDSDRDPDIDVNPEKIEAPEMKSMPNLEVEIKRGGKTLSFDCTMIRPASAQPPDSGYNDLFTINAVSMYEGECKETVYSVSGEVLDGTLYDLLMNLLEDKGISNDFIEKITDFSTAYEHSCYINLLEDLQKFVQGK